MSLEVLNVSELDIFLMSYDEPNADKHWSHLTNLAPWSKRVSGIKGFDSVHRHCASLSETEWFVTVDADTTMRESFLDLTIDLNKYGARNFCWASMNHLNGLAYGNGGLKVWHRPFALNMSFHEFGDSVDFCWDTDYLSFSSIYSDVHITGSAYQAFRAGYREGVKLTRLEGKVIPIKDWDQLHPQNLRNVSIWASIGSHHENGIWALLGTRLGILDNALERISNEDVNSYELITDKFNQVKDKDCVEYIKSLGNEIKDLTGISLPFFNPEQSAFIRKYYER